MMILLWMMKAEAKPNDDACLNPIGIGAIEARWLSPETLALAEQRRASVELREPDTSKLPAGGYAVVRLYRRTIEEADTENFGVVVVGPDGAELLRYQPPAHTAETPSSATELPSWKVNGYWWNEFGAALPVLTSGAQLFAIDMRHNVRCRWNFTGTSFALVKEP